MSRRHLSISLEEDCENDMEKSIDIGETTLRKDDLAINSAGVRMSQTTALDLETIDHKDLTKIQVIGRGCSGQVLKVQHKETGKYYAIKVVYNVYDKDKRDQLLTEIRTLYSIRCPWLVRCFGAFFKDSAISIILEFCDMGSLDRVIHNASRIPEKVLAAMTYQMLQGLSYLRKRHHFHRDIKPQNILVTRDGNIKLTDFGLARELDDSLQMANTFVGTFRYMSPERVQSEPYNFKSDIWSLGLVLLECSTGKPAYADAHSHIELVQSILESPVPSAPEDSTSASFQEFLNCCLKKDPTKRLPAEILLGAPWLQENGATDQDVCVDRVRAWLEINNESKH